MSVDVEGARRAARKAYEIGRVRTGALRGLAVAVGVATLGSVVVGRGALAWAIVPWLAWTALDWRGGALRAGGARGVLAGMVTLVLPMTWLRPCCMPGMMLGEGGCCSEPLTCVIAGGIVGLVAALALPRTAPGRRLEAALGLALGLGSVASIRCAALLLGEATGLLLGLAAGIAAASAAKAWLTSRRHLHT